MSLFLNEDDLSEIREKIQRHSWARGLFDRVEANAWQKGESGAPSPGPIIVDVVESRSPARRL